MSILALTVKSNLLNSTSIASNKSEIVFYNREKFTKNSDTLRSIKSTYIHFPLLIKYSAKRYNNIKPYVLGGLSTSFNLSGNQNSPEDNNNGVFRLKTNTFYYELGFGIDFYLRYFKFSPSIRGASIETCLPEFLSDCFTSLTVISSSLAISSGEGGR